MYDDWDEGTVPSDLDKGGDASRCEGQEKESGSTSEPHANTGGDEAGDKDVVETPAKKKKKADVEEGEKKKTQGKKSAEGDSEVSNETHTEKQLVRKQRSLF